MENSQHSMKLGTQGSGSVSLRYVRETLDQLKLQHPAQLAKALEDLYCFGTCPCGTENEGFNIGKTNFLCCHKCRAAWLVGENIFSTWRDENEGVWNENRRRYADYTTIEPSRWQPATTEDGKIFCPPAQDSK